MGEPVLTEFFPEVFDAVGFSAEEFEDRIKLISW